MHKEDVDKFVQSHLENAESPPRGSADRFVPRKSSNCEVSARMRIPLRSREEVAATEVAQRTETDLALSDREAVDEKTFRDTYPRVAYNVIEYISVVVTRKYPDYPAPNNAGSSN